MGPIGTFSIGFGRFQQCFLIDPPIKERDFFRRGNGNALAGFNGFHEVCRLKQTFHRSGIKPGKSTSEQLNIQKGISQIHFVKGCDFKLATGRRLNLIGAKRDTHGKKYKPVTA